MAAIRGPVREWSAQLLQRGAKPPFGFGLFFSASAAQAFTASAALKASLQQALADAQVVTWTANAFPFGDFHAAQVKEQVFLPDWRDPKRLTFTLQVAELLAQLAPAEEKDLSLSTCPLGYGKDALTDRRTLQHLHQAAEALKALGARTGKRLVLAIEPEPDGAFERVTDLAQWLADQVDPDLLPQLTICWDLCHSAVVGESTEQILETLKQTGVGVGKVQISSALHIPGHPSAEHLALLHDLTDDPYLHQVRGTDASGEPAAFADVPAFLSSTEPTGWSDLRVHCHVPVSATEFHSGLHATPWRPAVRMALAQGMSAFELETYTLPVLPSALLEAQGPIGTMVAESLACMAALSLDMTTA